MAHSKEVKKLLDRVSGEGALHSVACKRNLGWAYCQCDAAKKIRAIEAEALQLILKQRAAAEKGTGQ